MTTVLKEKTEGRKTRGRMKTKMLNVIMRKGYTKLSYSELKSTAKDPMKWCHHSQNLPTQAEN